MGNSSHYLTCAPTVPLFGSYVRNTTPFVILAIIAVLSNLIALLPLLFIAWWPALQMTMAR